jgi:acyl carrier protein
LARRIAGPFSIELCQRWDIEVVTALRYDHRAGEAWVPKQAGLGAITHKTANVSGKRVQTESCGMASTFDTVAGIIAETCDIPRERIKPESHALDDLGIDSLDFLDIAFAIDKTFGIKLPIEQWTQEVNDGNASTEQYFVLENLCRRIDDLAAAKAG